MSATKTITCPVGNPEVLDHIIESDFDRHPSELVDGGTVGKSGCTIQDLRNAIPPHCFEISTTRSFSYLSRDLLVTGTLMWLAHNYIPLLSNSWLRCVAWLLYGYIQGMQMTGLWVIGHEANHGSFSANTLVNDTAGCILHSALLTPFFSWRSTHRRHHIYANHLVKDHNYVPPNEAKYASLLGVPLSDLADLTEDSPFITLLRLVTQQLLGWPWYLLTNITAAPGSFAAGKVSSGPSKLPLGNSHFNPWATLFRPEEALSILASDLGVAVAAGLLWCAAGRYGWAPVLLLYAQPYLWLNHWIVAITYLHHTHPGLAKYEPEAWTFIRGATATVDRDLGFAGRHLMHNIADYHVVHHLFSRMPQYHHEEATKAIAPLLGEAYRRDRRSFWGSLWESYKRCQYVVPDDPCARPEDRAMVFKGGPSPPIEMRMGRGGLGIERAR